MPNLVKARCHFCPDGLRIPNHDGPSSKRGHSCSFRNIYRHSLDRCYTERFWPLYGSQQFTFLVWTDVRSFGPQPDLPSQVSSMVPKNEGVKLHVNAHKRIRKRLGLPPWSLVQTRNSTSTRKDPKTISHVSRRFYWPTGDDMTKIQQETALKRPIYLITTDGPCRTKTGASWIN